MDEDAQARMNDAQNRGRILALFNRSTLDDVGPIGGEHGMKVLQEMNSLVDDHDQYVKSLMPGVHVS